MKRILSLISIVIQLQSFAQVGIGTNIQNDSLYVKNLDVILSDNNDDAVRIKGKDGFIVTGTVFSVKINGKKISGPETRMFFNPYKSAFRAGTVFDIFPKASDEWEDRNIGVFSTAFGLNNVASGFASTA